VVPILAVLLTLAVSSEPTVGLAPADGLGLERTPALSTPAALPARGPGVPWAVPAGFGSVGALGVATALFTPRRRRREPIYVLVHGDGGSAEDFDRLLYRMGVTEDQTVAFDYREAHTGATSTDASRHASTESAANALDRLIRRVAADHGAVYSIHHSRGGAVGVEHIAGLDDGSRPPIEGYRGAALLDPAIGSGRLGLLQRLGGVMGFVPDNGGFDPMRCDDDSCRDLRVDLGDRAGVEVIAIRNPDALVTNFVDDPRGLRTYDLIDDGAPSALSRWWNPLWTFRRIFSAHGSVLEHRSVADCVRAESLVPGSCRWTGHRRMPVSWWGRGAGINNVR
jgi:hypothetical protein